MPSFRFKVNIKLFYWEIQELTRDEIQNLASFEFSLDDISLLLLSSSSEEKEE